MVEIWKTIPNFMRRYQISNLGNCRSLGSVDVLGRKRKHLSLKQGVDRNGYSRCYLSLKGKNFYFRTHRLVALLFIPNPKKFKQVNHIDGNKLNNFYCNLEWCNNSHNIKHAAKLGLRKYTKGELHPRFISPVFVYKNGILIDKIRGNLDAKDKGYDMRNISACLMKKRKKHSGCTFKRRVK